MATWDLNRPADTDQLKDLANRWREDKTALDSFLSTVVWWGDSATSAGMTKYSTATPGGARVFYTTRSEASYRRDTDLYILTDEGRFVAVGSAASTVLFSKNGILSMQTVTTLGQPSMVTACRAVVASGAVTWNSLTTLEKLSFGTTYGALPTVVLGPSSQDTNSGASYVYSVFDLQTSGCSLAARYVGPNASNDSSDQSKALCYWRSTGTVRFL